MHAAIGPGEIPQLVDDCDYQGAPSPPSAPTRYAQARAALAAIEVEWEVLEPLLDPDEAVRARVAASTTSRACASAATTSRASPRPTSSSRASTAPQVVLHNSMETHQSVVQWVGDSVEVYISTQYIWGVRDEVASGLGLPPDKVRVICHYMGGGFGSKNGAGRLHVHRSRARASARAGPSGAR